MKRIYVGNLARGITDDELEAAFASYGSVRSAKVIRDRSTGDSRGFGFVEMDNDQEAVDAIAAMDQKELEGRTLNVSEARPRTGGGQRGGGRGDSGRRGRSW
jgi:RNA recognition motif-containing protein